MKHQEAEQHAAQMIDIFRTHLTANTDMNQTLTSALSSGIILLSYQDIVAQLTDPEDKIDLSDLSDIINKEHTSERV